MGFVEFLFETKKGKTIMGLLYGLGAAVVIVGALFKIMHWPGAGPMLVVGLSTEALIFAVSAFEPQHMPLDWTLAYPELAGMDDEHGHKKVDNGSPVEQLDNMLEDAKIDSELIESLGTGLRSLSTNASKLSEISDAEYDTLKKEILSLEEKYEYLVSKDSPSKSVGFKPSKNFKKVQHRVPMLSLANAFSEEDLLNFEKKIRNFLFVTALK